ncbi:MAG: fumarylacetoacetate hydrolase family protein [Pseudomonadota bacterium]
MQLLSFDLDGAGRIGVRAGNEVVDLTATGLPARMETFLALGEEGLAAARKALTSGAKRLPFVGLKLRSPVISPAKAIAVGLNFVDHAAESDKPVPTYPVLFHRYPSSWVGPGESLVAPGASAQYDYEGEMVIVIGKGGRDIDKARALEHVAGYSVFNEGCARDFQMKSSQWMMGKNFDRSGGFGPWITTADELPPGAKGLRLRTRLNGQTVQDASTDDMIFDVATLVAVCSVPFALVPGDIIIAGTPAGVGVSRKPQLFMKPGDVCEVEVEGIGTLSNPVIAQRG